MKKREYFILFFIGLIFYVAISLIQKTPGYMDASYYYLTGRLLATGRGSTEPFLWNYLTSPQTVQIPIFAYWMPLAGLMAAIPMAIFGQTSFQIARIFFILLASLIPVLCYHFATWFSKNKFIHWLAAFLGLLGGYYLPYLTLTETFVPFFILGALYFWICFEAVKGRNTGKIGYFLGLGVIAGLMHLTRADGILWLLGAFFFVLISFDRTQDRTQVFFKRFLAIFVAYLLVMIGWFARNLVTFHSLFPTGNNLSLWMTEYNDLFLYPVSQLTPARWLASGVQAILTVRLDALLTNLQNCVGIIGGIVLFPFLLVGLWKLRKEKVIQFALWMFLFLFIVMSLIFPFAGARGGFFHSASAFQILFWAISAFGFEQAIRWIAARRNWKVDKSIPLLGTTLLLCVVVITAFTFFVKYTGLSGVNSAWEQEYTDFHNVEIYLVNDLKDSGNTVMVNDSPGFYAATGRKAIQEAKVDLNLLKPMMKEYEVKYLVIGKSHLESLNRLYEMPEDQAGFIFMGKVGEEVLYELPD